MSFQALSQALGTRRGPGQETLRLGGTLTKAALKSPSPAQRCPSVAGREASRCLGRGFRGSLSLPPPLHPLSLPHLLPSSFFSEPTKESASYLSILAQPCWWSWGLRRVAAADSFSGGKGEGRGTGGAVVMPLGEMGPSWAAWVPT